jgi:hypothetical protein
LPRIEAKNMRWRKMAHAGSRPQGRLPEHPTTPRTGHALGYRANSLAGGKRRSVADGGYNISDDDV